MRDDNLWYTIILDNWAQIVVLLGVLGYIIRLFIDWNIKKNEISFSKIQEIKILEVKEFYKSYQSLRIALQNFINQTEFGKHSPEIFNEIRDEIRNCYIDFEYNCMTVKLFIEKPEISTIENIISICESIRVDIERWHIYKDSDNPPKDWDKLYEIREERFTKTLPNLIKRIETSLRKSYNID